MKINSGNCCHDVWPIKEDTEFKNENCHILTKKGVWISNNDDGHYCQCIQTPEEVDELIEKLQTCKKLVFGD